MGGEDAHAATGGEVPVDEFVRVATATAPSTPPCATSAGTTIATPSTRPSPLIGSWGILDDVQPEEAAVLRVTGERRVLPSAEAVLFTLVNQ